MKWLIASDLHGSAYYCKALLEAFAREQADRILFLGDILYHGPRNDLPREYNPKAVITALNEHKQHILSVRGNCEAEVDQMVLAFPCLADCALLPVGTRTVFATHGHVYNERSLPPLTEGDILLHGHTHIPVCKETGGIIIMNPGSLSIPKENSRHSYMTLEDNLFLWKDLSNSGDVYMEYRLP